MKVRTGFISNSSSSSFVCDVKSSLDEVREQLKSMLYHFNQLMGTEHEYADVFGEVISTSETVPHSEIGYAECSWYTRDDLEDKIIIRSANDNTIPYELFDLICGKFDAFRIHRG